MRPRPSGHSLLDLLCGTAIGLVIVTATLASLSAGFVAARSLGGRGEADETAEGAIEAFAFDVRRLGYDPRATGAVLLTQAMLDRVTLQSDLDGSGTIDATSEETVAFVCNASTRRLSRIVGGQSLPLADGIRTCRFGYRDADGLPVTVPTTGLTATARARVRAITFELILTRPLGRAVSHRRIEISLRTPPP